MWVAVSLLSSKSECHHLTLAELPGNEDERCMEQSVSESPSFPSAGQMCHLFCHSWSWAMEAAVAIERNGKDSSMQVRRWYAHVSVLLHMHRCSERIHKKLVTGCCCGRSWSRSPVSQEWGKIFCVYIPFLHLKFMYIYMHIYISL